MQVTCKRAIDNEPFVAGRDGGQEKGCRLTMNRVGVYSHTCSDSTSPAATSNLRGAMRGAGGCTPAFAFTSQQCTLHYNYESSQARLDTRVRMCTPSVLDCEGRGGVTRERLMIAVARGRGGDSESCNYPPPGASRRPPPQGGRGFRCVGPREWFPLQTLRL
jgi:hypothetical protein